MNFEYLVMWGMAPHRILGLMLIFALSLNARIASFGLFSDWWDGQQGSKSPRLQFSGLSFELPKSWVCERVNDTKLSCRPEGALEEVLIFEKITVLSSHSLPLIKLLRKRAWENNNINQYVDESTSSPLGIHPGNRGVFYRNNNISSPVLIRAFDVVVDDRTCVSITSKCNVLDCPVLEKEVLHVVSSLSKSASK